ncbi:MAG: hypothetical protein ACI4FV_04835 [Lachnospiraceae bacterium]
MQIREWFSKCKISRVKSFCALFFLVALELAALSGRANGIQTLGNSLNTEGEWQLTASEICESGEKVEPAGLWSGRQLETITQVSTGRQHSVIRMMIRSHAVVCGLLLLCFFSVFTHLIIRYGRKKLHSYTENIISYLYCTTYL